ncbi:MAG: SDR family NAD(P)-dependent oxidoreductase [Actinomycetota bacterium]|nr:SDR family NAD(P)-dependent oxidoreductase [Actinomycetota bacterium]
MSALARIVDVVLDRTVMLGYTRPGYLIRSAHWSPSELEPMPGKVVLVTGATSGLGTATAEGFARLGAQVWLLVRDLERGERVRAELLSRTGNHELHVGVCDLSELRSVRRFVGRFSAQVDRLDVLVNNAGVLTGERELSRDGIELTLATNVVGPFLLTKLLLGMLERSAPSRVINVSSGGMYAGRIDLDDLQAARGKFRGAAAYARAKRAQVILTEQWAARLQGMGVVVQAMHPGWVDTPGLADALPGFRRALRGLLRTPEQGADTIVWLGSAREPLEHPGSFWHDRARRPTHLLPSTREPRERHERLWSAVETLSG